MANWAALNWSESVNTGKSGARALLTMLCLKCDDDGRVFRTIPDLAKLCEMSVRTAREHLLYLEQIGLITQIQRMRTNKSETRSVLLINYPDAPHLHGEVKVLDYATQTGTRVMYPKHPIGLLELGVAWSSNGTVHGVHPDHEVSVEAWRQQHVAEDDPEEHEWGADFAPHGGADFAGGRGADFAGPPTRGNDENPRSAARGGAPQISHPQGSTNQSLGGQSPTNQGRDGWLVGSNQDEPTEDQPAGYVLLSELGVAGKPLQQWTATVTDALAVLGKDATREQLAGGSSKPGPGAIVQTRLPALARQLAAVQQSRSAQQQAVQEQKQQRQQKSKQAAQHNPAGSSPVGWLSDQQFASLTVLERKLVTRAAHEGVDVLDGKSRTRVTNIRRRFESDHDIADADSAPPEAS